MIREIQVASSDGASSYLVVFEWNGKDLSVTCNCRAGYLGQACRHKEGLLLGNRLLLPNPKDESILVEILRWVDESPVRNALSNICKAEAELQTAQAAAKAAKKALVVLLNPKKLDQFK